MPEMLYKQTDTGLHYWQAWNYLSRVTTVTGRVGECAKVANQVFSDEAAALEQIEAATATKRAEGFAEISPMDHHQVVVQWRKEKWASMNDAKWRDEVESAFDEGLEGKGLGYCDGHTFGGFKVQIFCLVLDAEQGAREMIGALEELERLDGAVVAIREGESYRVVFPPDHQGGFSIL
jgi:predicted DNA-binding WGR domain protein